MIQNHCKPCINNIGTILQVGYIVFVPKLATHPFPSRTTSPSVDGSGVALPHAGALERGARKARSAGKVIRPTKGGLLGARSTDLWDSAE